MSIGDGIAILGVWGFVAACALSSTTTSVAFKISWVIGLSVTAAVLLAHIAPILAPMVVR